MILKSEYKHKGDSLIKNVEWSGSSLVITWADETKDATTLTTPSWSTSSIPNLSTDKLTSGTLGVTRGGTGKSSWTQYAIPYASATNTLGEIAIGKAGQALIVNGNASGYTWATFNNYSLTTATTSAIGGIKIYKDNADYSVTTNTSPSITADVTTAGKYYGVEIDKNDKAYVYVPWTNVNSSYMTTSHAANNVTSTKISNWDTAYNWYNTITGEDSDSTDTAINKWNEIIDFLKNTSETDTLSGLLSGKANSSHTHGNITNGGCITSDVITPAANATETSADFILLSDTSNSGKIERGIQLKNDSTLFLRSDGTWVKPSYTTNTDHYETPQITATSDAQPAFKLGAKGGNESNDMYIYYATSTSPASGTNAITAAKDGIIKGNAGSASTGWQLAKVYNGNVYYYNSNNNTRYYLTLNGTVNGTASTNNLGTIYAATTAPNAPTAATSSNTSTSLKSILIATNTNTYASTGNTTAYTYSWYSTESVGTQSQTTKFLRSDGTWATPSYTTNTNTTYGLYLGAQDATANASSATTNTATYLNLRSSTSGNNNIKITGSGSVSVSGNGGTLTITGTTYTNNVTSSFLVGPKDNDNTTKSTANGSTYLKFKEGSTRSQYLVTGGTGISITNDDSGNITITNTSTDLNHNVTSHLYAGISTGVANLTGSTTQADPYLLLVEGSTLDSKVQLVADTGISITASAGGIIKIKNTSPDLNHNTDTKVTTSVTTSKMYLIGKSDSNKAATSVALYDANLSVTNGALSCSSLSTGSISASSNATITGYLTASNVWNISTVLSATSKSVSVSAWTDVYSFVTTDVSGTYIILISGGNLIASGIFSYDSADTDDWSEEIPLHVYGDNGWRPYARTTAGKLQVAANLDSATDKTITVKIKRII